MPAICQWCHRFIMPGGFDHSLCEDLANDVLQELADYYEEEIHDDDDT